MKEQKGKSEKKARRRAVVVQTTSYSGNDEPTKNRQKTEKNGKSQNPENAFDFEEEMRPPINELSSTNTEFK